MIVEVFPNTNALSRAVAERFVASARVALAERDAFYVALGGGKTPRKAYELLASEPYTGRIDWRKVHVYFGDERNVPTTDPESNEGMAREAFLDSVPIPSANIHGMYNGGSAEEAAAAYERILKSFFAPTGYTFDLAHLGVGPDGHTASLFPRAGTLQETRWVAPAETEMLAVRERITLTPAVLCRSRGIVFEVAGADKAEIIRQIIDAKADYPAGVVARCVENSVWMLDEAAASLTAATR